MEAPATLALRTFVSLEGVEGLVHAVTTRPGGVSEGSWAALNLGLGSGDDPTRVEANRAALARHLGMPRLVLPRQVHGARLVAVGDAAAPPGDADALLADRPGVLVGVLGADCPGLLLVAPTVRALAVVHVGWRGLAADAPGAALDALAARGAPPASLRAAIGPGICGACYEVGPEVVDACRVVVPDVDACVRPGARGRPLLDLRAALALRLVAAGVPPGRVERMAGCTREDAAAFFSHRRDGSSTGRHALVAGWRPAPSPDPALVT